MFVSRLITSSVSRNTDSVLTRCKFKTEVVCYFTINFDQQLLWCLPFLVPRSFVWINVNTDDVVVSTRLFICRDIFQMF